MRLWEAYAGIGYSPRRKLIISFHEFHNFLQGFFIFDIHLITDVSLPIPIVDHGGGVDGDAAPKLEVASFEIRLVGLTRASADKIVAKRYDTLC